MWPGHSPLCRMFVYCEWASMVSQWPIYKSFSLIVLTSPPFSEYQTQYTRTGQRQPAIVYRVWETTNENHLAHTHTWATVSLIPHVLHFHTHSPFLYRLSLHLYFSHIIRLHRVVPKTSSFLSAIHSPSSASLSHANFFNTNDVIASLLKRKKNKNYW